MQTWTCEYCPNRSFHTEDGLAKHMMAVHSDQEKQTHMKPTRE